MENYAIEILILKLAAVLGAISAIAAFCYKLFTWCKAKVYVPGKVTVNSLFTISQPEIGVLAQLAKIQAQLVSNGGSSLRDAINRIEAASDYQNAKFRFYDELLNDAIFEIDEQQNCIFVNSKLCDLLGYEKAEILGKAWLGHIKTDEQRRIISEWYVAVENKIELRSEQTFRHGITDDWIYLIVRAKPHFNRKGDLCGFFGSIKITDQPPQNG